MKNDNIKMLNFESDYTEGCHEKILQRLLETNLEQLPGYGSDLYTERAKQKIREACACPQAEIFFLAGGTQTNQVVISSVLRPYEGVVAATTGHVSVHEAGAIESCGHKVLEIPQREGKVQADVLDAYLQGFWQDENREHMVFPGMVYISHPTEYGTLYTKEEMRQLSAVCRRYQIPLYMDGARLGYGLASPQSDMTLADVAELCDIFYIGGTKVGALMGEAVVFTKNNMPPHFLTLVKQRGALLAKGRLLGIQFDVLFTDDLYASVSRHAIETAQLLKEGFRQRGYEFLIESPTNQQFIILDNARMEKLAKNVRFSYWEPVDGGRTAVRFATSWATKRGDVEKLMALLDAAGSACSSV